MSSDAEIDTKTRILQAVWQLMEERRGQGVSMGEIARATGISRQAVYLHYPSRTELVVATINYVDEVKGLDARLAQLDSASTGIELLDMSVEVWGNYIPEIYGLAKAMMLTRDSDEAMATAWEGCMACLHDAGKAVVEMLAREGKLTTVWTKAEAIDLINTLLSISHWEQLTLESGWTNKQYVERMKRLLRQVLLKHEG